ncbi:MAG: Fic family protein [Bdellovibrio sp.]|nr:Fic family protein [Bdellovibrio sp.]
MKRNKIINSFMPKYSITNIINKSLVEIERVRGFLDAIELRKDSFSEMQKETLMRESHYSTHIEGTLLSLDKAKDIIEGKKIKTIRIDDKKELLNYKNAMDYISTQLGKNNSINEKMILALHKVLVRGSKAHPGNYRKTQNYVVNSRTNEVIYTPPKPREVPQLMKQFTEWLKTTKDISPVLIAGIAQFQCVHIHPFVDGNGRAARVLSTLILYQMGYDFKKLFSISEYYDKDRPKYYQAIQSVRDNNMDMTAWLEYFIEGLRSQMLEIQKKGTQIINAEKAVEKISAFTLNPRQQQIFKYLLLNKEINNDKCQNLCKSIKRTATRDLALMVKLAILDKRGEKKGTYYVLSQNIVAIMRDIKGQQ